MSQESTVICVDNSEWTRNGDHQPTRLLSQVDAAQILFNVKLQSNPENTVGVITLAGDRVVLETALTQDGGRLNGSVYGLKPGGTSEFVKGIQTAQLTLKHRPKKNQQQRIICFVASPIEDEVKDLEALGRTLKKNNVFIDIISFGEVDENREKLEKFMQAAGASENNRYLEIPAGGSVGNTIVSSPLGMGGEGFGDLADTDPELAAAIAASMAEMNGGAPPTDAAPSATAPAAAASDPSGAPAAAVAPAAAAAGLDLGVDPTTDPELYMALRMSLEEAQNAERAANEAAANLQGDTAAETLKEDPEPKTEEKKE